MEGPWTTVVSWPQRKRVLSKHAPVWVRHYNRLLRERGSFSSKSFRGTTSKLVGSLFWGIFVLILSVFCRIYVFMLLLFDFICLFEVFFVWFKG